MRDCKPTELAKPRRWRANHKEYVYLTAAEVKTVRARAAKGHKTRALAADFQVCEATIRNIVRQRTRRSSRGRKPCTFLSTNQIRALRGRARAGADLHALAAEFRVTRATVKNLRDGRTRRDVAD